MKSLRLSLAICLSIVFTLEAIFCIPANAQSSESEKSQDQPTVSERIQRVENGLLPPFQIKGESTAKMNISDRMKHYKVPGISVAVINNGKIEWQRSYGVKEAGKNDPVSVDTMFQAASISKPIAAMAALKMVQDGKLSLDEDVNKKLVSWKCRKMNLPRKRK
ncbi:MAG TPA: serine hydrolase domain-containing protein [Pyrinomonadaceae bacterium]|jgi:CubicO group peptidase (beta-lactamase class C family)